MIFLFVCIDLIFSYILLNYLCISLLNDLNIHEKIPLNSLFVAMPCSG